MSAPSCYSVNDVTWEEAEVVLVRIRRAVFVLEQGVPEALECDGLDADCLHVLARDASGTPVGTGRLLPEGHAGRIAVLAAHRGLGVGRAILSRLVVRARLRGDPILMLNAQTHAVGFYQRSGFRVCGGEFLDAGIPHVQMRLELVGAPPPREESPRLGG